MYLYLCWREIRLYCVYQCFKHSLILYTHVCSENFLCRYVVHVFSKLMLYTSVAPVKAFWLSVVISTFSSTKILHQSVAVYIFMGVFISNLGWNISWLSIGYSYSYGGVYILLQILSTNWVQLFSPVGSAPLYVVQHMSFHVIDVVLMTSGAEGPEETMGDWGSGGTPSVSKAEKTWADRGVFHISYSDSHWWGYESGVWVTVARWLGHSWEAVLGEGLLDVADSTEGDASP